MLKIEDVKAGDELVCIDRDELRCNASIRLQWRFYMSEKDKITVSAVGADVIYIEDSEFHITKSVLQYFKKKEQSQQYTFGDLIDVVTKAFKDRAIFSVGITICAVSIKLHDKSEEVFTMMDIDEGIDFIQSLYKETFVIETEEDIKRIKKGADITLSNSNTSKVSVIDCAENTLKVANWDYFLEFFSLKGATVEQERGRDD